MLHAHHPTKSLVMDVLEHVLVIDLARGRLLASRVVAYLEVRNLVPRPVDVRNEVAFLDLLML